MSRFAIIVLLLLVTFLGLCEWFQWPDITRWLIELLILVLVTFGLVKFYISDNSSPLTKEGNRQLKKLIKDLGYYIQNHSENSKSEIERANILMQEAIGLINSSFLQVNKLMREQYTVLESSVAEIIKANVNVSAQDKSNFDAIDTDKHKADKWLRTCSNILATKSDFEAIISQGVRCLQFEDLAVQTLDLAAEHLNFIENTSRLLVQLDENNLVHSSIDEETVLQQLENEIDKFNRTEKSRKVAQSSMDAGDVELF